MFIIYIINDQSFCVGRTNHNLVAYRKSRNQSKPGTKICTLPQAMLIVQANHVAVNIVKPQNYAMCI
jgi:hypothetical protein